MQEGYCKKLTYIDNFLRGGFIDSANLSLKGKANLIRKCYCNLKNTSNREVLINLGYKMLGLLCSFSIKEILYLEIIKYLFKATLIEKFG